MADYSTLSDALAEWLRRVPAKYMGFPRESSNLSGVAVNLFFFVFIYLSIMVTILQSRLGFPPFRCCLAAQFEMPKFQVRIC